MAKNYFRKLAKSLKKMWKHSDPARDILEILLIYSIHDLFPLHASPCRCCLLRKKIITRLSSLLKAEK